MKTLSKVCVVLERIPGSDWLTMPVAGGKRVLLTERTKCYLDGKLIGLPGLLSAAAKGRLTAELERDEKGERVEMAMFKTVKEEEESAP